ncbi:MAG TPA: hypothetical protein VK942_14190 [Actinomycetes bacterium]|nr:hypothetical protein [Actinomycetes bacterium]
MAEYRAGGHIDRGDGEGWVLDDTQPEPAPEPVAHKPLQPTVQAAGGWRLAPEPEPEPEPPKPEPEPEPEPERPSNAEVRAWAKTQGIDVHGRGPLPDDLVDQYLNREA